MRPGNVRTLEARTSYVGRPEGRVQDRLEPVMYAIRMISFRVDALFGPFELEIVATRGVIIKKRYGPGTWTVTYRILGYSARRPPSPSQRWLADPLPIPNVHLVSFDERMEIAPAYRRERRKKSGLVSRSLLCSWERAERECGGLSIMAEDKWCVQRWAS